MRVRLIGLCIEGGVRIRAAEYLHYKSADHERYRQISGFRMQGSSPYI